MLTVIIKGTNGCNLACSYCSLGKKTNFHFVRETKLIEIFRYICNLCRRREEKNVTFILHGGEPTMVSPGVYKAAIDAAKREFPDMEIEISMQTNGFAISREMIDFIREYDVHIGVSMDGSKQIHDLKRKSVNGKGTYDQVIQNIDRLMANGIRVSALMVLTSNAWNEGYDFIRYFAKKGIYLKINPLLNYGEVYEHPELSLEPGAYAHYLIGLYEYVMENDIDVRIAPIDNILQAILGNGHMGECAFCSTCSQNFLCIDHRGDIYPCGKYSDLNIFRIGNVSENKWDIFDSEMIRKLLARRTADKPEKCRKCKYLRLCNAGCNAEASIDGDLSKPPVLCRDYEMIFSYFHKDGLRLLQRELLRQKEILEKKNGV